jgi:hypothetical protein
MASFVYLYLQMSEQARRVLDLINDEGRGMIAEELRGIAFRLLCDARKIEGNVAMPGESPFHQEGLPRLAGTGHDDGREVARELFQFGGSRAWIFYATILTFQDNIVNFEEQNANPSRQLCGTNASVPSFSPLALTYAPPRTHHAFSRIPIW